MKSRYLFVGAGLLVCLVGVAGAVYALRSPQGQGGEPPVSSEVPQGDTIRITDNGFEPSYLRVQKGTTVHFINETDEWRWPASDPHPIHTNYPGGGFDPRRTIAPGEEWTFTFDVVGEWGMHDHLAPYIIGKIIVEE